MECFLVGLHQFAPALALWVQWQLSLKLNVASVRRDPTNCRPRGRRKTFLATSCWKTCCISARSWWNLVCRAELALCGRRHCHFPQDGCVRGCLSFYFGDVPMLTCGTETGTAHDSWEFLIPHPDTLWCPFFTVCSQCFVVQLCDHLRGSRNHCQTLICRGSGASVTEPLSVLLDLATHGIVNGELTNCPRTADENVDSSTGADDGGSATSSTRDRVVTEPGR